MTTRRTVVITGASDGIGAVTARALAKQPDVDLIIVGRSQSKLDAVAAQTGATAFAADFGDLDQVRALAKQLSELVDSIDVLANNAGGTFPPKKDTVDGHEPNFQINHLAGFLLTNLLRDQLAHGSGALVLNTSSVGNNFGRVDLSDLDWKRRRRSELITYGTSKLQNILFTRGIATRWGSDGIVSAAFHPGPVGTSFGRDSPMAGLLYRTPIRHVAMISPAKGAAPMIELIERGADQTMNGAYFHRHREGGPQSRQARDPRLIAGLWTASEEMVGLS